MDNILTEFAKLFPQINAAIAAGLIVFARLLGFTRMAPIFSRKEIPNVIKTCFALIFSICLIGVIKPVPPPSEGSLMVSFVLNITVGLMIGYMARLVLVAVEAGADMINMQMGLSSAMVLDPTTQSQISLMEKYFSILGILIFIQ